MKQKPTPLEPIAKLAFAGIIFFFVILISFGVYCRYQNNSAKQMPDQVIRVYPGWVGLNCDVNPLKCDTIIFIQKDTVKYIRVPYKYFRIKK